MKRLMNTRDNNYWKGDFAEFFKVENELRLTVVHQYIADAIIRQEYKDILDFGCGEGDLLDKMHKMNLNSVKYTGYDPSVPCIEKAEKKFKDIEFVSELDALKGEKFDAVILSFVLITIDNEDEAKESINSAVDRLKPGENCCFVRPIRVLETGYIPP